MFALRHIKTGKLMPQTGSNRGYSHWDPDSPAVTPDAAIPGSIRLFPTAKGADNARVAWAAGVHKRHYGSTSGTWNNPPEHYDETEVEDKGRNKGMLEVVPMIVEPADQRVTLRVSSDLAKVVEQLGDGGVQKVLSDYVSQLQKGTSA